MSAGSGQMALVMATRRLKAAGVPGASQDARRLLAWALQIEAGRLTLVLPDDLALAAAARFETAIAARTARHPVSHIIGQREFYGRRFKVTPDVLDPRPETETLVAAALEGKFDHLLDLGTGSGAILISLLAERPGARGLGVDLSDAALEIARENARALAVDTRAEFLKSDWYEAVRGKFDLIVSNPPYITGAEMRSLAPEVRLYEPQMALTPGPEADNDGLDAFRVIAANAARHLNPGGKVLVEIGYLQGTAVASLFARAGFFNIRILQDLNRQDRVVRANSAPG